MISIIGVAVDFDSKNPRTSGLLFKKKKTCSVFLSRYRNTRGSLGEREMLKEHEPQASISHTFSEFSQTFMNVYITR